MFPIFDPWYKYTDPIYRGSVDGQALKLSGEKGKEAII